ncbi:MAG: hypothetical protein ACRD5H_14540, partial [Nitrososphaerales archaeon]
MPQESYYNSDAVNFVLLSQEILEDALLGKAISREEAYTLIYSSNYDQLLELADRIRKKGKGNVVTYSRKVFIPLTNLCRDTCSYCTYKR